MKIESFVAPVYWIYWNAVCTKIVLCIDHEDKKIGQEKIREIRDNKGNWRNLPFLLKNFGEQQCRRKEDKRKVFKR